MPQQPLAKTLKLKLLNISLLVFSIMLVVLLTEILLRFTRCRYYFVKYPSGITCGDEFAGYDLCENHPSLRDDYTEFSVTFFTNALGCFDREYLGEKDYILLTGDSFTFGHAPFEEKYGTLLEGYLGQRVLKCGVGGYGTIQEYFKIKKVAQRTGLSPQLIIVGYWMGDDLRNDLDCLQQGLAFPQESVKESPAERLLQGLFKPSYSLHHPNLSFPEKAKEWIAKHSLIYHFFNKNTLVRAIGEKLGLIDILFANLEFAPLDEYTWLKDAWEFHLDNLKQVKKLADSYQSELLIVLLPANVQVYDFLKPKGRYDFSQPNRILTNFFEKEGIAYLDLTPLFREFADLRPRLTLDSQKDLFWRQDEHFNKRGNRLAALLIARHIIEHDLARIKDKVEKIELINKEIRGFSPGH